ncbi:MAG: hypothetical protein ABII74_07330 [Elusimicrobiota bacterium]
MKKYFTVILILFFFSLPVFAKMSYLEKAYFGAYYMGSVGEDYYQFQNEIFPLVAVKVKLPLLSGSLNSIMLYDFEKPGANFWWSKDLSSFQFNVGYLGRPITMLNRPQPVSAGKNFEPPAKSIIPGPAFGILLKKKFSGPNNNLMLGMYKTRDGSVEFDFGFQQNINRGIIRKFSISGYGDGKFRGMAFSGELGKISLTFYSGQDRDFVKTRSGIINLDLRKNVSLWTGFVNQDQKWQWSQVGICKTFSEKVGVIPVNYLLGASYTYSEVKPDSINVYLQVWLDKN